MQTAPLLPCTKRIPQDRLLTEYGSYLIPLLCDPRGLEFPPAVADLGTKATFPMVDTAFFLGSFVRPVPGFGRLPVAPTVGGRPPAPVGDGAAAVGEPPPAGASAGLNFTPADGLSEAAGAAEPSELLSPCEVLCCTGGGALPPTGMLGRGGCVRFAPGCAELDEAMGGTGGGREPVFDPVL